MQTGMVSVIISLRGHQKTAPDFREDAPEDKADVSEDRIDGDDKKMRLQCAR